MNDAMARRIVPAFRMLMTGADGVEQFWAVFDEAWATKNGLSGQTSGGQTWRLVVNDVGINHHRAMIGRKGGR